MHKNPNSTVPTPLHKLKGKEAYNGFSLTWLHEGLTPVSTQVKFSVALVVSYQFSQTRKIHWERDAPVT